MQDTSFSNSSYLSTDLLILSHIKAKKTAMVYNRSSKVRWRCARGSTRLTFTTSPESSLPYHSYYCFASIVEEAKAHILIARSASRSQLYINSQLYIVYDDRTDYRFINIHTKWLQYLHMLLIEKNLLTILECIQISTMYTKLTIIRLLQKFVKTRTLLNKS